MVGYKPPSSSHTSFCDTNIKSGLYGERGLLLASLPLYYYLINNDIAYLKHEATYSLNKSYHRL